MENRWLRRSERTEVSSRGWYNDGEPRTFLPDAWDSFSATKSRWFYRMIVQSVLQTAANYFYQYISLLFFNALCIIVHVEYSIASALINFISYCCTNCPLKTNMCYDRYKTDIKYKEVRGHLISISNRRAEN